MASSREQGPGMRATAIPQYSRPGIGDGGAKDHSSHPDLGTTSSASSSFALPPSDVETTNWNAVKMLASKYGITLKSAAEVQSSAVARAQRAEDQGTPDEAADTEDLGVGTPFEIIATKLEGGRFIYRFKWRGRGTPPSLAPAGGPSTGNGPGPGPGQEGGADTDLPFVPRSISSGAIVGGKESAAAARFRKSGSFMLKSSRSIPVLRGNRSATGQQQRNVTASGETGSGDPSSSALYQPSRYPAAAGAALGDHAAPKSNAWRALGVNPAGPSAPPPSSFTMADRSAHSAAGGSVAMARAESTPVKGAHAKRNWTGRLEEGDVLGAILGLRHEAVLTAVEPTGIRQAPGAGEAPGPELAPTWATTPALKDSEGRSPSLLHVRPFGNDILLQPDSARARNSPDAPVPSSAPHPTRPHPLISNSLLAEHTLPELDFGTKFAKSPRLHQLRETPSSTSMASDATAKGETLPDSDGGGNEGSPAMSHPEADASVEDVGTVLFDVLQDFTRPSPSSGVNAPGSPRSSQGDGFSAHRRFNSADLLTSHGAQGSVEAQKHFIAEAQSLPTSAAPGDDPRFALWAVRGDSGDGVLIAAGRDGDTSPMQSLLLASTGRGSAGQKRRESRSASSTSSSWIIEDGSSERTGRGARHPSKTSARGPQSSQQGSDLFAAGKAVLLAATPARIVAEITSEIDQALLTDFFFTYREYLAPTDLLRLLTLRFDWALAEPTSAHDEARRRIVRVRTYVTIKFWLLHHFEYDFLPNRELRQRLARWLNDVIKDQRMQSRPADLGIIKSLHKIVRGLKATYGKSGVGALLYNDAGRVHSGGTDGSHKDVQADFDGSAKEDLERHPKQEAESPLSPAADDVDLSFAADEVGEEEDEGADSLPSLTGGSYGRHASGSETVQAIRAAALKAAAESVVLSPHRQVSARLKPTGASQSPNIALHGSRPPPLPHANNTLSRVFVQTVGRLSRFKRVLGSRSTLLPSMNPAEASHEDLEFEANDSGDLLFIRGGLESFMQYFDIDSNSSTTSGPSASPANKSVERQREGAEDDDDDDDREGQVSDGTAMDETPSLSAASVDHSTPASSIDLTPRSSDHSPSRAAAAKQELGLGIQGVSSDLSSEFEDLGETAQPATGPLGLDLGAIGSLTSARHLQRGADNLHHTTSDQTLRSVSRTDEASAAAGSVEYSARRAPSRASSRKAAPSMRWSVKSHVSGPRIVQIDDIDLSSDEDDGAVRRALRRLPGARDLRMANNVRDLEPVRQSIDSMASSFAQVRTVEAFSTFGGRPMSAGSVSLAPPSQPAFGIVHSEMLDPDEALQGYELVKGFQLDGFDSDDDEPGDVEAALRRLEGIIDEDKQRERAKKVEVLWQKSLARNAGEGEGESSGASAPADSLDDHGDGRSSVVIKPDRRSYSSAASLADNEAEARADTSVLSGRSADADQEEPQEELSDKLDSFLDLAEDDSFSAPRARRESASSSLSYDEQRSPAPSLRAVLPAPGASTESVRSAKTASRAGPSKSPAARSSAIASPSTSASGNQHVRKNAAPTTTAAAAAARTMPPLRMAAGPGINPPPVHRSFLLAYRSDVVARQMCLIEAELLQAVSWDELAGSRWKERRYKSEVTDWESFYRDRVRDRLEAQKHNRIYRECAVEAIVARFNLTSNWVASEVVLTQNLDERVAVVSKLIRIALRCYLQCNYASLAQIIFGLSTPWVERLRRTWSRVGYYEMRIWRDLNSFVNPKNNFRHLRNAMHAMAVDAGIEDLVTSAGSASFAGVSTAAHLAKQGCIPFFGLFVSDLMVNDLLPSHLDPSSPDAAPHVDADTGRLSGLAKPDAFDHLAPLPPGVELEPLVNLYKYRVVSSTIKHVLAFQERAKAYSFEADAGVYVKCLKIRCLQGEQLAKVSHAAEA
ncbi:uncharacterized protein PFL1_01649 [Pseudozyma flocculosa PF-1]|uniref:Ras GEF n=1 Tax=Pseudozyma flocculosa TaxID=84751 RepID=A0A5C3EZ50_9BASI|nr:uncharacterized protein PFL1_01649 [Pseudozyma flocculosa PF-1]EPQ30748.1 hypothetical protein PFL1_01649 [Pseudozyma flocculosa PF-1]SPO36896.1 uncharacterized protein PSFLO_02367 [Pseudozyma flocculosa]